MNPVAIPEIENSRETPTLYRALKMIRDTVNRILTWIPDSLTGNAAGVVLAGDLNFPGSGHKITGDLSGAIAGRLAFQTSTPNSPTAVNFLPSGSAKYCAIGIFCGSDPLNAAYLNLTANPAGTFHKIISGATGTATALPMGFFVGSATAIYCDASARVGIGGAPANFFDVLGDSAAWHFKGATAAPTIAAGTGAGTGSTVSVTGTDVSGKITVVAGVAPAINATVVTVTFNKTWGAAPSVLISPSNQAAWASWVWIDSTPTTTTFLLSVGGAALTNGTTYVWQYMAIQ